MPFQFVKVRLAKTPKITCNDEKNVSVSLEANQNNGDLMK